MRTYEKSELKCEVFMNLKDFWFQDAVFIVFCLILSYLMVKIE